MRASGFRTRQRYRTGMEKLLFSRQEAADRLSMSLDTFERRVQPHLALVPCGRLRLVPVAEVERWVAEATVKLNACTT